MVRALRYIRCCSGSIPRVSKRVKPAWTESVPEKSVLWGNEMVLALYSGHCELLKFLSQVGQWQILSPLLVDRNVCIQYMHYWFLWFWSLYLINIVTDNNKCTHVATLMTTFESWNYWNQGVPPHSLSIWLCSSKTPHQAAEFCGLFCEFLLIPPILAAKSGQVDSPNFEISNILSIVPITCPVHTFKNKQKKNNDHSFIHSLKTEAVIQLKNNPMANSSDFHISACCQMPCFHLQWLMQQMIWTNNNWYEHGLAIAHSL